MITDTYLNHMMFCSVYKSVSLKPAKIAKFCGGDRIEGFEDFLNSKQARQVQLLTKTIVELYDEMRVAKGARRDSSLADMPVYDLKNNPISN